MKTDPTVQAKRLNTNVEGSQTGPDAIRDEALNGGFKLLKFGIE